MQNSVLQEINTREHWADGREVPFRAPAKTWKWAIITIQADFKDLLPLHLCTCKI